MPSNAIRNLEDVEETREIREESTRNFPNPNENSIPTSTDEMPADVTPSKSSGASTVSLRNVIVTNYQDKVKV